MADVINSSAKKVIKGMVITCQTARFVSLMPKPQDFITRIVGDVVYLSAEVQKLSDEINRLLEQYSQIPVNYLMTQVNSITGSMSRIVDRTNTYVQTGVNNLMGLGENTMDMISELTGDTIDIVGETSKMVTSFGSTIAHTSSAILGKTETANNIYDATEVILEWTGDGFKNVSEKATTSLNKVSQGITDTKTKINSGINDVASKTNETIDKFQRNIETLLKNLQEKMNKLSSVLDSGFQDVTGLSSVSTGASYVNEALKESDNTSPSSQAVVAISQSLSNVIKNFSISKVIGAFGGVLTQSIIVKTGLDQLPPINFEEMISNVRDDLTISNEDLYKELDSLTDSAYNDVNDFNKTLTDIPAEEKEYGDEKYKEYLKQFDEEISKQRELIRISMQRVENSKEKLNDRQFAALKMRERRATKSAIKEVKKFRKQVFNAKQTSRKKDIIGDELTRLRKEVEYRCNSIKSDWNDMMDEYRNAIKEIKSFFQTGGDGDMFIDDCCNAINQDCNNIKELCKNLTTQLIGATIKVAMPADIGACVPNPAYKIADLWTDIKTIIKFIKDLITLIIDIMNNVNKLARIMLNGINSLSEIIQQLMKLLGLQWFMDLIQNILDFFGGKMGSVRELLENMLSPVYYRDTEEYDNTMEILENMMNDNGTVDRVSLSTKDREYLTNSEKNARYYVISDDDLNDLRWTWKNDWEEKYDKFMDKLESKGDEIVAYKSPILADNDDSTSNVSGLMNGETIDNDIKFVGWYFYHPNLDHTNLSRFAKKFKKRVIQKASKKSTKKNGGVNKLKNKKIRGVKAYNRFYWYAYYTEDLEKDCYVNTADRTKNEDVYIDSVVQTENGSIVNVEGIGQVFVKDNMVKSGDYVNVNGKKYRVK